MTGVRRSFLERFPVDRARCLCGSGAGGAGGFGSYAARDVPTWGPSSMQEGRNKVPVGVPSGRSWGLQVSAGRRGGPLEIVKSTSFGVERGGVKSRRLGRGVFWVKPGPFFAGRRSRVSLVSRIVGEMAMSDPS